MREATVTLSVLIMAAVLSGCVKQSAYEALQLENQQLQRRIDQANEQTRQAQAELKVQQLHVQQLLEVQTKLQKSQEQLKQAEEEVDSLKEEFEKFRTQRRSAMIGKQYPVLHLDNGKSIKDAVVTALNADEIAIRHDGGFIKLAMIDTNEDLRWEACFDPLEAKKKQRERMLAEARMLDATLAKNRSAPPATPKVKTAATISPAEQLKQMISEQRKQLNAEFDALRAKNEGTLRPTAWNYAAPEASPLLNNFADRRAVLGMSRLEMYRDAINANLRRLRDVTPKAP